jgi:hypothetical protein
MKANSVLFPLTNPSERLDKVRRLAASASACQKSKATADCGLGPVFIWGISAHSNAASRQRIKRETLKTRRLQHHLQAT